MAFAPPEALEYLGRAHAAGRLGHAYLLVGGEAAFDLARQLAALVVRADAARVLTHPDVHVIEPESKSRRISIEQVRVLENALRLRASADGGRKVGLLREADRLTTQAANAFLKTLEEPPADCLLLLLSAQPESLMETILSRCVKVTLRAPADATAARTAEEISLLEMLDRQARLKASTDTATVPTAYGMQREFMGLLGAIRARLQTEAATALAGEEAHYAQTTDGSWLDERGDYYKSLTEARYLAERSRLVETLSRWWGEALRRQATGASDAHRNGNGAAASDLLRRLAAIDTLRENLDRNIQEALALEVAFLRVFAPGGAAN